MKNKIDTLNKMKNSVIHVKDCASMTRCLKKVIAGDIEQINLIIISDRKKYPELCKNQYLVSYEYLKEHLKDGRDFLVPLSKATRYDMTVEDIYWKFYERNGKVVETKLVFDGKASVNIIIVDEMKSFKEIRGIDNALLELFNRYKKKLVFLGFTQYESSIIRLRNSWKQLKEYTDKEFLAGLLEESSETKEISIDSMTDGHSFERYCADLLKKNGFEKVIVTPGSGDQGIDILCEKEEVKYAIQCKCYSKDLGNTPVQEAYSGAKYYNCHVPVVMTNRGFTNGAQDLAKKTNVLLWGRKKLNVLAMNAK